MRDMINVSSRKIILTNTQIEVIVDNEDIERIQRHNWFYQKTTSSHVIYCSWKDLPGCTRSSGWGSLSIAKFILNLQNSLLDVDHINRNQFDNRKVNLREATRSQNLMNREKLFINGATSKYKGVCFRRDRGRWRAKIQVDGKVIYGGMFDTEIEAALQYNKMAKMFHKEFAVYNIID